MGIALTKRAYAYLLLLALPGCTAPNDNQTAKPKELSPVDKNYIAAINGVFGMQGVYVLVTVVDGSTKVEKTGCVYANGLLGAIHREHRLDYDDKSMQTARQIALAAPNRKFVLTQQSALRNIDFKHLDTRLREECALVREGWSVWQPDFGPLSTNKPGYKSAHISAYAD